MTTNLYHALTTIKDKSSSLTTGRNVFIVKSIIASQEVIGWRSIAHGFSAVKLVESIVF